MCTHVFVLYSPSCPLSPDLPLSVVPTLPCPALAPCWTGYVLLSCCLIL
jgi:hypothetical protein